MTSAISTMCIRLGRMWRRRMAGVPTPKARAACTYSSSRSLRVSPRKSRASPVQLVMPRMKQSASRRASERSAAVSNHSGWVSITTCIISTAAAISSTPGMALSTV